MYVYAYYVMHHWFVDIADVVHVNGRKLQAWEHLRTGVPRLAPSSLAFATHHTSVGPMSESPIDQIRHGDECFIYAHQND